MAENQNARPFNPNEHLMQIKSRNGSNDYLPVQWRLVWFRSICPEGTIETEIVHLDLDRETEEEAFVWNNETRRSEKVVKRAPGFAVCRAVVKDGKGGMATGTKSEKAASFADFLEKAETGAIGRALAALGYGTQFTGEEFDEGHRIVDAPVERAEQNGVPAPQSSALAELRRKLRERAQANGVTTPDAWNALVIAVLGKAKADLDISDIGRLNAELYKRERTARSAEVQA